MLITISVVPFCAQPLLDKLRDWFEPRARAAGSHAPGALRFVDFERGADVAFTAELVVVDLEHLCGAAVGVRRSRPAARPAWRS